MHTAVVLVSSTRLSVGNYRCAAADHGVGITIFKPQHSSRFSEEVRGLQTDFSYNATKTDSGRRKRSARATSSRRRRQTNPLAPRLQDALCICRRSRQYTKNNKGLLRLARSTRVNPLVGSCATPALARAWGRVGGPEKKVMYVHIYNYAYR